MRHKLGITCMALGLALLAASMGLLAWNRQDANRAEQASMELMDAVADVITELLASEPVVEPLPLPTEPEAPKMTEVEVDGHLCVGYVTIPQLNLELPVLAQCNDENLKVAPCRYSGTTMEGNLVLAGHNYRRHFGPIRRLKTGDEVIFVDMDGVTTRYLVAATDAVAPTAVADVTCGQFDLALVTCTYGGTTRLVVYCDTDAS